MKIISNIAGYKFVELSYLPQIRADLLKRAKQLDLKGTVLLAEEGINIMLAGEQNGIAAFIAMLNEMSALSDIVFKKSYSDYVPFKRLLVKIKKEIITFAKSDIAPAKQTGKRLSAREFKQWLDEHKEMLVLDTRNRCEIAIGKFNQAVDLAIDNFRDFPAAITKLPLTTKKKPIVMYCTGGIRCEKASALLLKQGFTDVYQLDGGILQYFEDCGSVHFSGQCFVFDERGAVDATLHNKQT